MGRKFYPKNQKGYGCIYRITNLINGKEYIGQTANKYSSKRWDAHKHEAAKGNPKPLYRAMKKYGVENFVFKVMLTNIPVDQLDFYEILWIKKKNSLVPKGYNLTKGGDVFSYKGEENLSFGKTPWNKGIPRSEDCKEKIKQSWTEEKRKQYSDFFKRENNPMYGKHFKGVSRYGKDNPFFQKHHSEDTKKKIKEFSKEKSKSIIRCDKETGKELQSYDSIREATKWVCENTPFQNPDHSFISRCAQGKHKYAYGYNWKFKE